LRQVGLRPLDAPVSGGVTKATSGQLSMMASGSIEAFAEVEKLFAAIAATVYRLGEASNAGSPACTLQRL
jgi:3-hydroxyisobutyrate dehydrogenase-like beta-hydroxyacid dehydrogenase